MNGFKEVTFSALLLGALLGCSNEGNEPAGTVKPADTVETDKPSTEETGANVDDEEVVADDSVVSISLDEYVKRFNAGDIDEFRGKTIEFGGYLNSVDESSSILIGNEPAFLSGAPLLTEEKEIWSRALPYQQIKTRTPFSKLVNGTVIISWVSDDRIVVTAEELSKAFADDAEQAMEKYHDKYLEVSGKLVTFADGKTELAGHDDAVIRCYCTYTKGFAVGENVRLAGRCDSALYDGKVVIMEGRAISKPAV